MRAYRTHLGDECEHRAEKEVTGERPHDAPNLLEDRRNHRNDPEHGEGHDGNQVNRRDDPEHDEGDDGNDESDGGHERLLLLLCIGGGPSRSGASRMPTPDLFRNHLPLAGSGDGRGGP